MKFQNGRYSFLFEKLRTKQYFVEIIECFYYIQDSIVQKYCLYDMLRIILQSQQCISQDVSADNYQYAFGFQNNEYFYEQDSLIEQKSHMELNLINRYEHYITSRSKIKLNDQINYSLMMITIIIQLIHINIELLRFNCNIEYGIQKFFFRHWVTRDVEESLKHCFIRKIILDPQLRYFITKRCQQEIPLKKLINRKFLSHFLI